MRNNFKIKYLPFRFSLAYFVLICFLTKDHDINSIIFCQKLKNRAFDQIAESTEDEFLYVFLIVDSSSQYYTSVQIQKKNKAD